MINQKRLWWTLSALTLIGCSSAPKVRLPVTVKDFRQTVVAKLEAEAQIVTIQKLAKDANCEKVKRDLRVSIKGEGENIRTEPTCRLMPGSLVVRSNTFLSKGEYVVSVDANSDKRKFSGKPVITANCRDPEMNSGAEQDFGGALELAENQTLKGAVSHAGGNATKWISVKAKSGSVALFFVADSPDDVQAKLYALPKGADTPQRIGTLPIKVKKHLRAPQGTIYVQISAKRFAGEVHYSLSRRDTALTKTVNIPVIDCYPLNGTSSVVLLTPTDTMKVNDELTISALKNGGGTVALGKCVVNSVSESQASCRMNGLPPADVSHYKAQLIQEG